MGCSCSRWKDGKLDDSSEIKAWVKKIEMLSGKKHLESYVFSRKRSDFFNSKELADFINNGPGENDLEKFWMIFLWITENIAYDTIGLKSGKNGKNDADSVIRMGFAVCEGFSNLFCEISNLIGLECVRISGYAKGVGYKLGDTFDSTNHAWNVITVENRSFYVDSTWSCRRSNSDNALKDWNPYWFMTPPEIFLESHLSPEFILHPKCTKDEFEKMHFFELLYHIYGFECDQIDGSFIKSTSNPAVLELTSAEDCELLVDLVNYETDEKINEAVTIQKDSAKDPSRYCLIIDTSSNRKKYYLNVYARKISSKSSHFSLLTNLILTQSDKQIQVNQLENLIPAYNLTYLDNKLRLISHKRKIIPLVHDKLIMEFEIDNSLEPLYELKSFDTKEIITDAIIVQCEHSLNINKYCAIISINHEKQKFILNIFAKNLKTIDKSVSHVTEFKLVLDEAYRKMDYKNLEKLIPAYNLTYLDNKLRLISHKKSLILANSAVLSLEFEAYKSVELMAILKEHDSNARLDERTFIQYNPTNSHIVVNIIFPSVNKIYNLALLSKKENNLFYQFTELKLFNNSSICDNIFVDCYSLKHSHYIYEPFFKNLKFNSTYRFKYYFENAKVVFFTFGKKEIFLEKNDTQANVFEIEFKLDQQGELNLCIKYEFGNSYSILCEYFVE